MKRIRQEYKHVDDYYSNQERKDDNMGAMISNFGSSGVGIIVGIILASVYSIVKLVKFMTKKKRTV